MDYVNYIHLYNLLFKNILLLYLMIYNLEYNNTYYHYQISKPQWESNSEPAMMQSISGEIIQDKLIEKKLHLLNLSYEIKNFYKKIGTSSQEIYIKEWTFLSIENITKMIENYKKDNIITIDFAYKYMGMGYVKVAFYDNRYNSILYRNDGGSNGYDRAENYENLKNFNNSQDLNKDIGINFNTFLFEIVGKKFETAIIF